MGKPKSKKRPKTAEEIRQQKRECEQRRRARIKENADLYEAAKEKDRARKKNQVKLVAEMSPREHRKQRKEWRDRKSRSRLKQKRAQILVKNLKENTPETTDDERISESPSILERVSKVVTRPQSSCASDSSTCSDFIKSIPQSPSSSQSGSVSRQKKKGVQASRVRRELTNLILKKQKETIEAMRKKIHSLQVKILRGTKEKRNMDRITKKRSPIKIKTGLSMPKKIRAEVIKFLERDDNSKMCPGKKDCITKNKIKKQKRYLSDTLLNLHKKFQNENIYKISFSSFCRLRPFWVIARKISERDTCLCVVHENMQLMYDKLKYLNIISHLNLRELCKTMVCDINSETCMLRKCTICKDKVPNINDFDDSTETTYKSWAMIKENRIIKGKEKEVRRTVKKEIKITKKTLVLKFIEALDNFLRHQYTITHQYLATSQLKTNLSVNEIFMQVDFAENYCCKYSDEIQAVHFGASRLQISLHTGVYYYRCPETGDLKSQSFCTASDCLRHDASAVFAHLQKILDLICLSHPFKSLHMLSDGPTGQYRNKKAFYLFTQYITRRYGIQIASWNFCEAGHGKGPMDGVGAVVKRTADRLVAQGEDIPDFIAFMKSIDANITNVTIAVVTKADMGAIDGVLSNQGKSISGTLKIHQVTWVVNNPVRIYLRKLTCLSCEPGSVCSHYSLGKGFIDFISIPTATDVPQLQHILSSKDENVNLPPFDVKDDHRDKKTDDEENLPVDRGGDNFSPTSAIKGRELKDGMWVIAKFLFKNKKIQVKHYVGQVIGFDGAEPRIKFTKKKHYTKDHAVFHWIEPEDVFPVPRDDVISILKEPTPGRRGELLFEKDELQFYKNI